ncbi:MAG: T9SS type A sorting domain-containing protein [Cytophagaceae bacterium]
MKRLIFTFIASVSIAAVTFAQTNSDRSGNKPNAAKTAFQFQFNGNDQDNCPNLIPYDQWYISNAYTVNSMGGGKLQVSTNGTQLGWHRINLRLSDANCNPISINLKDHQSLQVKLTSSVAVPQFMVMLFDQNEQPADANPPVMELQVGENILNVTDLNFGKWNSTDKIDSTKIILLGLYFRKSWDDNDGGASPSVVGTFDVDYIKIGDFTTIASVEKQLVESSLNVYPNPANGNVFVDYNASSQTEVIFSDLSGKVLVRETKSYGSGTVSFETATFPAGMYLVTVITDNGAVTRKISLQ